MKHKTESEIIKLLRAAVDNAPSLRSWAKSNKASPAYVSRVLHGETKPGKKILDAIGYERITIFTEKTK